MLSEICRKELERQKSFVIFRSIMEHHYGQECFQWHNLSAFAFVTQRQILHKVDLIQLFCNAYTAKTLSNGDLLLSQCVARASVPHQSIRPARAADRMTRFSNDTDRECGRSRSHTQSNTNTSTVWSAACCSRNVWVGYVLGHVELQRERDVRCARVFDTPFRRAQLVTHSCLHARVRWALFFRLRTRARAHLALSFRIVCAIVRHWHA